MGATGETEWLTSQQVAELLRVHPKHIYRLLKRGMPARRVGGAWRFERAAVLAWSEAGGAREPPPVTPEGARGKGALLAANGDQAVLVLLERLNAGAGPLWGFVQADRTQALAWLAEGRVLAAGSHGGEAPPLVAGQRLARIHLVTRRVGLATRPGVPVLPWQVFAGLRVAARPASAGVQQHLLAAVKAAGVDAARALGGMRALDSHRAVVGAVLRGEADVGLVTEAWALSAGLAFKPLATEAYGLLVRSADLGTAPVVQLCEVAQSAAFAQALSAHPGYDLSRVGEIRYDPTQP